MRVSLGHGSTSRRDGSILIERNASKVYSELLGKSQRM
nr:MAG TPA: hypothetical protein [Caudoviricetes sp.]